MHKGRAYPFANQCRILCVGQFDFPLLAPRTYDFTVTRWADANGVHPFVGTVTSDIVNYISGNRFMDYHWSWPCDIGHTLSVDMRVELTPAGIGLIPSGKVHLDGVQCGNSGTISGIAGDLILWDDWGGPIGTFTTPQHAVSTPFPTMVATPWP